MVGPGKADLVGMSKRVEESAIGGAARMACYVVDRALSVSASCMTGEVTRGPAGNHKDCLSTFRNKIAAVAKKKRGHGKGTDRQDISKQN